MQKILRVVMIAALLWSFTSTRPLLAADKMGYVDVSKLFDEYNKTKDYDKILDNKGKLYKSERDAKVKEIGILQEKYNLLTDKEKEKSKQKIEKMAQDLRQYDQQKQADLFQEREEKKKEIWGDIEKAAKEYAEKENYNLILNEFGVIYHNKNLDVTAKVAEILKKLYPVKK